MVSPRRYLRLDAAVVASTADSVRARIEARFPERGLVMVAVDVGDAARRVERIDTGSRLRSIVRLVSAALALVIGVATVAVVTVVTRDAFRAARGKASFEWLPLVESAINDVAFAGIAIFFLLSARTRLERRVMLADLHQVRALAHVIDMHQLTKDPERLLSRPEPTAASDEPGLDAVELGRYLDYCSELLSLVGKVAALYAQASSDQTVLNTVSEIEQLTVGLSRKIWQKIALLHVG